MSCMFYWTFEKTSCRLLSDMLPFSAANKLLFATDLFIFSFSSRHDKCWIRNTIYVIYVIRTFPRQLDDVIMILWLASHLSRVLHRSAVSIISFLMSHCRVLPGRRAKARSGGDEGDSRRCPLSACRVRVIWRSDLRGLFWIISATSNAAWSTSWPFPECTTHQLNLQADTNTTRSLQPTARR